MKNIFFFNLKTENTFKLVLNMQNFFDNRLILALFVEVDIF